jgi:hypothetical protein
MRLLESSVIVLIRRYGKHEKRKRLPALEQLAGLPEAADE